MDPVDLTAWTCFYRAICEWISFTDERTFRERYNLVRGWAAAGILLMGAQTGGPVDLERITKPQVTRNNR